MSWAHLNQMVVCIKDRWNSAPGVKEVPPSKGDTLRVRDVQPTQGRWYLQFHGRTEWYQDTGFKPIDPLMEALDRIETEGAPIEEPQPEFA